MVDADPALTPVSVEEISETIAREAPYAFAGLLSLYVDLVPVHDPSLAANSDREHALWLAGGMYALMIAGTAGQKDLADATVKHLVDLERKRRQTKDNTTHHQVNRGGTPYCQYCKRDWCCITEDLKGEDPAQFACDKAPR